MAENRPIEEKKVVKPKASQPSLFTQLEDKLTFETIFLPENYSKYVLKFLWFVLLGFIYIYNAHVSERFSREHDKLVKLIDDYRTHYTTLHADLMYESKESEVARKVITIGLTDNTAPKKLIVNTQK